jgi:hypothetical protein
MAKLLIGKIHHHHHLRHGHKHNTGNGTNLQNLKNMLKDMEIKSGSVRVQKKKKVMI